MQDFSVGAARERLYHLTKEHIMDMLLNVLDSGVAGAPYHHDDWTEAASCCSCAMDSPEELPPFHSPDDEEEDISLAVYMDNPENHDENCVFRVNRQVIRELGFHYEPYHVRLAVPGPAKE